MDPLPDSTVTSGTSRIRVILVSAGIFFSLGLIAAIGPTLPELARNNDISLAAAGAIFTALFVGAIPAQMVTGWLNDRFGPKLMLLVSLLVLAGGLLGATLSHSLPLTLACMVFAGLGDGVLVVGSNLIVAQSFSHRRASALNLLNVFYGVGAILGPAVAGRSILLWGTALPALWGLSAVLVLLAPTLFGLSILGEPRSSDAEAAHEAGAFYRSPFLWFLSALLLFYVGVEIGTGGWIATYMQRTTELKPDAAALVVSGFYLALTAGRIAGVGLGLKLTSERLLLVSLTGAVLGSIGMSLSVGNAGLTVAAVLLLGASFGPIFPTVLAIITARFTVGAGKAASLVIAMGSVGGMLIPLLQGALLEGVGAQSLAQLVVADTLCMLLILGLLRLYEQRKGRVPFAQGEQGSPITE
jgi:fucose permease